MSEITIKTENLGRDYGSLRALEGANLEIERGRVVALLGPNGAGKTTFLHIVMGLLEPTCGKAWLLGADSRSLPSRIASQIGYMGDGDEPPRWTTAEQLIGLQAGACGNFEKAFAKKFLAKLGLSLKSSFGALSKGQKKWVRAALVLAGKPQVLVLDEPAEGLDPSARRSLYDELRDYVTDSDATAIVATHIIADIERVADDVAIINKGHVVTYSALEQLREQVREIQLPAEEKMLGLDEGTDVLGSREVPGGGSLIWVRCSEDGQGDLERIAGERGIVRPVGLETFYLAMTEHNGNAIIEKERSDGHIQQTE